MKTLLVTNDYPPRQGGIQTFVRALVEELDPTSIAVFASTSPGAAAYDADAGTEVFRYPTSMLLPTPRATRAVIEAMHRTGADRIWFGAAAPLGLMAPTLRAAGATRLIGSTHGHETGWAQLPGARGLLRRITDGLDVTTYITEYTRSRLAAGLAATGHLERLSPGVDVDRFHPTVDGSVARRTSGFPDDAVVIGCISRLVPRKGQDMLIRAMPQVLAAQPKARLLIVGGGRDEERLRALVAEHGVEGAVVLTGAVPSAELPAYYAACDVFAMPCRTRRGGLDVEGLGMVYLEAAATGKPVVAGTSGGAPEAVLPGQTGLVVEDAESPDSVAAAVIDLATDGDRRREYGIAGREWVQREWTWPHQADRLRALLAEP